MLIKTYKSLFQKELSSLYDVMEIESFFFLILVQFRNLKRIDLALQPDLEFSDAEISQWNLVLEELKQEIPIQYILGITNFFGLDFQVNPDVLIPRPETEELVDWIIKTNSNGNLSTIKILDIGTGSGCIAISLSKNLPNASIFALDVSKKALEMAQINTLQNETKITFIEKNILETTSFEQQFDVIVSNPPYVRNLEKAEIKKNVLENEPHLALFVADDDALLFYRKIAQIAMKNLQSGGQLYFEINQYLGKETFDLLSDLGFQNIELRQDIYGNDRMISCRKETN